METWERPSSKVDSFLFYFLLLLRGCDMGMESQQAGFYVVREGVREEPKVRAHFQVGPNENPDSHKPPTTLAYTFVSRSPPCRSHLDRPLFAGYEPNSFIVLVLLAILASSRIFAYSSQAC